ncbi:unnamed protein product [Caenorhabditis bovis]|uniref:Signal recognition particle receptor subunit beta n=1 Tax=Caenorhabditis bovis TaxID=2654633 RepID=A0A8S1EC41_9PELO|nr:unnamed protein product [Caenorhabditis bovis]
MGAKSKYVVVQLASVITGSTRVWVRERAAEKFSGIFFDPAYGKECLFEESKRIKGKSDLPKRIKEIAMDINNLPIEILIAAILGLITILGAAFWFFQGKKRDTILIAGLSDSGKTVIFSQLVMKGAQPKTFTSMVENSLTLNFKGQVRNLVDFPGNDRLRRKLINRLHEKNILKIVFVVDSATFSKKSRDVAELLYDVCLENEAKAPILVACHKQDHALAKTDQVIRSTLEKEFGLINNSRSASLKSTDGSESRSSTLTQTGADFKWGDLKKQKIDFVLSSSIEGAEYGIDEIRGFVRS